MLATSATSPTSINRPWWLKGSWQKKDQARGSGVLCSCDGVFVPPRKVLLFFNITVQCPFALQASLCWLVSQSVRQAIPDSIT